MSEARIIPTVGRIVWYTPSEGEDIQHLAGHPLAAIITAVWNAGCVNLAVFDANGQIRGRTSVPLIQNADPSPGGFYCEWMPYQKGQAAKTEALEAKIASQPIALNTGAVGMTFGDALQALKAGQKVARAGWNGKGMWLSLSCNGTREVAAENFWSPHNAQFARENGGTAKVMPAITLKMATGEIMMGWTANQADMLADDWMTV